MRQTGVLAAPGLIALRDGPAGMIERLADDHANARRLAEGLASMDGISDLDPTRVRTNFVFFRVERREAFLDALAAEGVLMIAYPHTRWVRAVTHYGVDASDIDRTIDVCRRVLAGIGAAPRPALAMGAPTAA